MVAEGLLVLLIEHVRGEEGLCTSHLRFCSHTHAHPDSQVTHLSLKYL